MASWHDGDALNNAARAFHDKYARQPSRRMQEARALHNQFMGEVEQYLRNHRICLRIDYSGSSYEGVKVSKSAENDDLEFDVMIIMPDGRKLVPKDLQPGFAQLKPRPELQTDLAGILSYRGIFSSDSYVDAGKVLDTFFGKLQNCIDQSSAMKGKVKLRKHGPAAQMDVHPDSGIVLWGPKLFSVDVVPAFDVGGRVYVAKPIKNQADMPEYCWRRSFSNEEKEKLDAADRMNGCRKQVLRTLKVIRNREAGLSLLTSYHLKTALFREMDDLCLSWTYMYVGRRLMGVIGQLEAALARKSMPHYFIPEINLLSGMSARALDNMRDRLQRMLSSQHQMMQILNS